MLLKILVLSWFCAISCFGSDLIENMTLEEKVGQILMVHFHGEEANEDARILIQDTKVGGIIYYNWSNGLHSPSQVQALSAGLQEFAKSNRFPIPLLIAADQEGGIVARLRSGFTEFPGNRALSETCDPSLAEEAALVMGQELQAVGVNMNLAPVVDVNSNPRNPVIGIRSFGNDPEIVTAFGERALKGYNRAQVISTLKHFPGYGDVGVDPHVDLPVILKSKEELEQVELLPFSKLSLSADAIMTAHILVPALDQDNCATLSKKTLSYLRDKIGFQGLIVADSLVMDGVLKTCSSVDEASIAALNAGCDLLILGGKLLMGEHAGNELATPDVQRIHRSIIAAVQNGLILEERVDDAALRILRLKERYLSKQLQNTLQDQIYSLEHRAVAQKIASLALKVTKRESNKGVSDLVKNLELVDNCDLSSVQLSSEIAQEYPPRREQKNLDYLKGPKFPLLDRALYPSLHEKKVLVVAPQLLQLILSSTTLLNLGKSTQAYYFSGINPSQIEVETAEQYSEAADVIIVCSYNAWRLPPATLLAQTLLDTGKPFILLSLKDPLDASIFPTANLIFESFSPTVTSVQAICDRLVESF